MDRCTAVVLPGRTGRGRRWEKSVLGRCRDIGCAPATTRDATGGLCGGCCGVYPAEEGRRRERILRPEAGAGQAEASPAGEGEEGAGQEREETTGVQVLVARASGLSEGTAVPYVELRLVCGNPFDPKDFKAGEVQKQKSKAIDSKTSFRAKTKVLPSTTSPSWNEAFTFEVPSGDAAGSLHLYFRLLDREGARHSGFLGHTAVGLLDALVASKDLSTGWRALLRQTPAVHDRLAALRDGRLRTQPPCAYRLQPPTGQASKTDSHEAELFIAVSLLPTAQSPAGNFSGGDNGPERPALRRPGGGQQPVPLTPAVRAQLQRELIAAVAEGDVPQARRLLGRGAAVNAHAEDGEFKGCSALHVACLKAQADLAMVLVDVCGASLVQPAPGGRSAAMCACEAGDEALAEWLIAEGVPADLQDDAGRTVLFHAARAAMPELMSWLLGKQHLAPNSRAADGSTALAAAVASGRPAAAVVAQQLLEAKASAELADRSGEAPLHVACKAGDDQCVRLLLTLGRAKADSIDSEGRTALEVARRAKLPPATLKRLLTLGGESGQEDASGRLPGETVEEAEKRELRAQKAKLSEEEPGWHAWRYMHPRRELGVKAEDGVHAGGRNVTEAAEVDDDFLFAGGSARTGVGGGAPFSAGPAPGQPRQSPPRGRLARLRHWASASVLRRRSTSPAPASARQDSWSSLGSPREARF